MDKLRANVPLRWAAGVVLITIAATAWGISQWRKPQTVESVTERVVVPNSPAEETPETSSSQVLPLVGRSPQERVADLMSSIANGDEQDRNRARYLLAIDTLQAGNGEAALNWLAGLEHNYTILAPQVLLQRARAYRQIDDPDSARTTLETLIADYPNSPTVPEALYLLGEKEPQSWQQLLDRYPESPLAGKIARHLLADNPNERDLLLVLAKSTPNSLQLNEVRDRLVEEFGDTLTPTDWEAIAAGYWETWQYAKAGKPYGKAPATPENLYRHARGLHLNGENNAAKEAYEQLIAQFPDAEATGLGMRRYALLVEMNEAIALLDRVIAEFPEQAPDALAQKARLLESNNRPESAHAARTLLLTQYPNSEAAAEYRWELAQRYRDNGDLEAARKWATEISVFNSDRELAAEAGFWRGKWAKKQGDEAGATEAFEQVLIDRPDSYYAWRSAVYLGWDVGDFNTIRTHQPELELPEERLPILAGSPTVQELYQLGQDEAAFLHWQMEIADRDELDPRKQFTDGVLHVANGHHLHGLDRVWRSGDPDLGDFSLQEKEEYWYALFPFPYNETISRWSQERQVNPLLSTALIRQESRFEPEIRSWAGAMGLMQVMPATAEWIAGQIQLSEYSLTDIEDNVKLGTWYLDYTHRKYANNSLLAVASYNAGPGNVSKWVGRYRLDDPDLFVENIPFNETHGYVKAVFGNYWNYLRLYDPAIATQLQELAQAKATLEPDKE